MTTTDAALLEALGDCLESGDTLPQALGKLAMAGGAAGWWTDQIRRSVRADVPAGSALRQTRLFEPDELPLLPAEGPDAAAAQPLHAVVLRRRRGVARRRAILWGLVAPFAFAALTVLLDPLPNLVGDDPFLWPEIRGLLVLTILGLTVFAGLPALLRRPRARARILRMCSAVPGLRWFTALYAEEELTTALVPFVVGEEVSPAGLAAAASLLAWSPLAETLRGAAASVRPPSTPLPMLPMAGLEPIARQLSLATNLAVLGGVASRRLADRLTQRGDAIAALLTSRLRLTLRIVGYSLVVVLSIGSLVGMISRGLPGMPTLPGGATTPDQQQLEDLLKQLEH
jgi:hypothetical protein